jgi:hypothetical protein
MAPPTKATIKRKITRRASPVRRTERKIRADGALKP